MSEDTEPITEQPTDESAATFDFGKKKKKKAKKEVAEAGEKAEETAAPVSEEKIEVEEKSTPAGAQEEALPARTPGLLGGERDYTYEELANRIFGILNSGADEKVKYTMKPPVVYRDGTKKTVWANFPEICKIMNRSPDHVLSFVFAEVGSTGSIDGNGRLVIKARLQPKHIENLLRRYISEYVKCHTCKLPETTLKKENRLLFMVCSKCGSSRSVAPIKSGFQAATRASRREAQEKS